VLLGDYTLDIVNAGPFRLDGGSMFGIIPKLLWERERRPDERNRIQLGANCPLLRGRGEVLLIDSGNGTKLGPKEQEIFALAPEISLVGSLAELGVRPEEVTLVLYTHLHMDHCGGGTIAGPDDAAVPTFPNARYLVQRQEWEDALANRSTMRVSYRPENLLPLQESGLLQLLDGDTDLLPGIRTVVTGGHTRAHQMVRIDPGRVPTLCFGDLVPTTSHLRAPYLMAYDLFPYDTMQRKMPLIEQAAREGWTVVWGHDPDLPVGRIVDAGGGRYEAAPLEYS
jgi:glyoxylase-like metal-dependent hydrolase (beta-lactamase superfamily II)